MNIKLIETSDLQRLTSKRTGETKIGETVIAANALILDGIKNTAADFVIFGIPEDIGPRANCGKGGSDGAWEVFLKKFLNMQSNHFLNGKNCLILGSLDCSSLNATEDDKIEKLRAAVEKLDLLVGEIVNYIVAADKIPIIIGGGHNNAYGALKGCSTALNQPVNCINLDPHADYREREGRHSGNGFSYAKKQQYLDNYAVLGLHESYNSENMFRQLRNDGIHYILFEDIFLKNKWSFPEATKKLLEQVSTKVYGIELDCDAIENFPSSAQSPSGVSANEARQYVSIAAASPNAVYFHLPEAAPSLVPNSAEQVGKLLAYLVGDFIKAKTPFID